MGVVCSIFFISPKGKIEAVWNKVKTKLKDIAK